MDSKLFSIIGAVGSLLYFADMASRPPQPQCPSCGIPMYNPGTRYSRCVQCNQKIDWYVGGKNNG